MQDTDTKLTGKGGAGRGQGRKPTKTEPTAKVQVVIPKSLLGWLNTWKGDDRSAWIVGAIRDKKARIEQQITETDALIDERDLLL